jgi:hypothetical protein
MEDLMRSTHYAEQRSTPRSAPGSIPELRAALLGEVVAPDDPDYESARLVVNAAVDRRPALIVRPAGSADVALAVSLARTEGFELAVRGGGHSFAGHGTTDGGLVLDMSKMRALHVDPQRRIAWAQAGLTAEQYTAETDEARLAGRGSRSLSLRRPGRSDVASTCSTYSSPSAFGTPPVMMVDQVVAISGYPNVNTYASAPGSRNVIGVHTPEALRGRARRPCGRTAP